MLDAPTRAHVRATAPVLQQHGVALTRHFYARMFQHNPELREIFNQGHQRSGTQQQALAMAVAAYAEHIDDPTVLMPVLERIAAKHVSLGIRREHYAIVGRHLLASITEVLGEEAATPALMDAWAQAYGQLAALLAGMEQGLYDQAATQPGGWTGWRSLRVQRRQAESEEITSFHLQPADGGALLDFIPGQYIGLRLWLDGEEVRRNYSLSQAANGREYRISVKREVGGRVSNHLHEQVREGDELELFAPAGDFTLSASRKPLVLISAGVGITPLLAMLEAALPSGRPIRFIHCARHAGVQAFAARVDALAAAHPQLQRFYCLEQARAGDGADAHGRLSLELLQRWLPAERDVDAYFLGPKPFMAMLKRQLRELGVPEAQARYEFFGPAAALQD